MKIKLYSSKKNKNIFSSPKGFTLIELLIVIVIIGILASLLMVNFVGVRGRARDAQRKADLHQIQSALELYRSDNGLYPANLPACGSAFSFNGINYMQKIPCDPTDKNPLRYKYKNAFGRSAYTISACLENLNDNQKDATNNPSAVDGTASISTCDGTSNWSYTLFSP